MTNNELKEMTDSDLEFLLESLKKPRSELDSSRSGLQSPEFWNNEAEIVKVRNEQDLRKAKGETF